MCTKVQLQAVLRTIYQKSVEEFGEKLDAVILYGSYARGDYDEESDIDIMVRVRLERTELHQHLDTFVRLTSQIGLEYNIFVSVHLQDCETFDRFRDDLPFYTNVVKEGITIFA